MRSLSLPVYALAISLAACSGPQTPFGAAPSSPNIVRRAIAQPNVLYVADYGSGAINLLRNSDYHFVNKITSGISAPLGMTLDRSGNLYVANASGTVTEYGPRSFAPSFVYSTAMVEPFDVAVDAQDNLYEIDTNNAGGVGHNDGSVNEYTQKSNAVAQTCATNTHPIGIAMDRAADIFVAANDDVNHGHVLEYAAGLRGCNATPLGIRVGFTGGIAIDDNANLIVTDYDAGQVDVFAPPYTKVTRRLGSRERLSEPYNVSINAASTTVYVTDFNKNVVFVIDYATGKVLTKLDYSHGRISVPAGTVDAPGGD